MQQRIGKILWWDRRDREGIIVDGLGNQYFFNFSVANKSSVERFKDGQFVEFEVSNIVADVSCAKNVVVARAKKRAEENFFEQKQLSLGGF